MTLHTALRQGAELLESADIESPRLTAELLLCHALHRDRSYLYAHAEQELREVEWIHYGRYLHERIKRKPLQYITGIQEFYGRPFRVTPDVLIPRPETEHLIETALPLVSDRSAVIDVGAGSGAIAITLALETRRPTVAIDLSAPALAVIRRNADALGATVDLLQADLLAPLAPASAGLIVSNPPYVAKSVRASLQPEVLDWEPALALFGGSSGLDFYRRLIPEAERVLKPGGFLVLEIGAGQSAAILALFGPDWSPPGLIPDLAGIPRIISGTFQGRRPH